MQSTNSILMIEPSNFQFNEETFLSNKFQSKLEEIDKKNIIESAINEHKVMVEELKSIGIDVLVVKDTPTPIKPDAIFPNNWLMMHQNGDILVFPMFATNRRLEKRNDIVDLIKDKYKCNGINDYSSYENQNLAMEGTGSIVFNHISKSAYACISPRTDKLIFEKICADLNYKPISFIAKDFTDNEIYHTNVMMCIGTGYCIIGLDTITDPNEKEIIIANLKKENLEIIELTNQQVFNSFAGNMIELKDKNGNKYLIMSKGAYNSLTKVQLDTISKYTKCFPVSIDIIEKVGGGSARCMIAENFLELKS